MSGIWRFDTMRALWVKGSTALLLAENVDYRTSAGVGLQDRVLQAESCAFDLDLGGELWAARSRWTSLLWSYLPESSELDQFVDSATKRMAKRHKVSIVQLTARYRENSSQGNCIISWSFRAGKDPALIMHSRTSYIAWVGGLDLGISHKIAERIATSCGLLVDDIAFTWFADSIQWHATKSLGFVFSQRLLSRIKRSQAPAAMLTYKALSELERKYQSGTPADEERYSQTRQVRRRYERVRRGEPAQPSLKLSSLGLEPTYNKHAMRRRRERTEALDAD